MIEEYLDKEIEVMPLSLQNEYMKRIKEIVSEKDAPDDTKEAITLLLSTTNNAERFLKRILSDYKTVFMEAHSRVIFNKSYKYSAFFKLEDDREVSTILEEMSKVQNDNIEINSNLKMLKYTFLLQGARIINDAPVALKTTYSPIVKFWEIEANDEKYKFVEIDTENIATHFRTNGTEFFSDKINFMSELLTNKYLLTLVPIIFFDTLENIKNDEQGEDFPQTFGQKMVLRSGAAATLVSSETDSVILPILGELKQLMKENDEMFSSSPEIKDLLETFVKDTEVWAEFPWVTLIWNHNHKYKNRRIQVKFVLDRNDFTLLNYYWHMNGRSGMNDVVEYLLKKFSSLSNHGEEISEES